MLRCNQDSPSALPTLHFPQIPLPSARTTIARSDADRPQIESVSDFTRLHRLCGALQAEISRGNPPPCFHECNLSRFRGTLESALNWFNARADEGLGLLCLLARISVCALKIQLSSLCPKWILFVSVTETDRPVTLLQMTFSGSESLAIQTIT